MRFAEFSTPEAANSRKIAMFPHRLAKRLQNRAGTSIMFAFRIQFRLMNAIAIDYGTSNCACAYLKEGNPVLVELEPDSTLLPSLLWSPHDKHVGLSGMAIRSREVQLGAEAMRAYLDDPSFGHIIKSPKNFLAVELDSGQKDSFEAITAVFLRRMKEAAELKQQKEAEIAVLGRPVNYHGHHGDSGNDQAIGIMKKAALEAGFKELVFEYEPVAAAVAYERKLTLDRNVLVLDAGGGTTDCTLMRLGPGRKNKRDRTHDILGTSGSRLGGVELDSAFAKAFFGAALGLGGVMKSGRPVPGTPIFDALSFYDIPAQARFFSRRMLSELNAYLNEAQDPEPIQRLIDLRNNHLVMRLNRSAELGKIGLSSNAEIVASLDYFDAPTDAACSREKFEDVIGHHILKMMQLMSDACAQAGDTVDEIFVTGGTSRLPILARAVRERFPGIPVVSGDDFGSVVTGLAIRAAAIE